MIAEIEVDLKKYNDLFPANLLSSVTRFIEKQMCHAAKIRHRAADGQLILTYTGPEITSRDGKRMVTSARHIMKKDPEFQKVLRDLLSTIGLTP